jgi:hypothetical protein
VGTGRRTANRARPYRFEWLYVTAFVEPATGRTAWNIANAVCKELFELILVDFANKRMVL